MSNRAHHPAEEGVGDFAASERIGAGVVRERDSVDRDSVDGAAPDAEVISSERDAEDTSGAGPRVEPLEASATPRAPAVQPSDPERSSAAGVAGGGGDALSAGPREPQQSAPREPAGEGAVAAEGDDPTTDKFAPPELGASGHRASDVPALGAAVPAASDDAAVHANAAAQGSSPPDGTRVASRESGALAEDVELAEPESIEVDSRDIESVEPAAEAGEQLQPYAGEAVPDVSEMTADELALATGSDGSGAEDWSEAELDAAAPEAGGPGEAGNGPAQRGARFDAPWVDEVPDPVTPYEQRVSETVRVADLPAAELLRGRVLANRYIAEEIAEQTPSSISYRAYHLALDRAVHVKILPRGLACPDETCQEVRRLAGIATGLGHPNIAATLDFGVLPDGWPFLVTEHLVGHSLAALLRQEGKFVLRRVLHIGKQLAAGAGAAHDAGLVHGLINPDNVFVVEPGSSAEVALLMGFGVSSARGAVPGPPRSGVFGVPFYVSPEQAGCRPLDARSDIYSLGVVLYELMTGRPPFTDGDFAGVLCQHLDDDAPPPSSRLSSPGALAKAMDAIIERCLRKEPARRYQTAAELAEDLIRLEAAAARTKRRPMPEVKRPTTTIHSPPPKAAESAVGPEAKVIVHDDADGGTDLGQSFEPAASQAPASAPAPRSRPGTATPVSGTNLALRDKAPPSVTKPPVTRAPRISVNQATVKISAVDRALLARPGSPVRVAAPAGGAQAEGEGWVRRVGSALKRLFGGGSSDKTNKP